MRTRNKALATLIVAGSLSVFPSLASAQVADWKQIHISPLPTFKPQQPQHIELANGMVIFLQEDHELPLIRGTARIRGGSREEPADKVGLVNIYGQVWRTGGTKSKTGDELDDYLEARAARVETGGGIDSTTVSWDCLKDNFDDVFKVFVELLQDPAFREDKIPLAQNQLNTQIARRNDDPMGIASREAAKLGYGADSPYARVPEYATVAAVTREDLVNWHQTYVHPNNLILGVVGDFDSKAMEERLRSAFESWPKGPGVAPLRLSFRGPKPGIYFIEKGDVNQSSIRMVALGTRRDNPDYYAIEVLNEVFGGSFASRLVQDIRTKKGLAYEVGGGVGTAFDHPGLFQISMGTKSGTTAAAIEALDQEIDGLKTHPPTPEELKKAKDSILNSFVFRFDTRSKVLRERMAYEFYGYPADFLEKYQGGIERVTQADVARAAERYVHRDQLAVLVVGKAADFDRPLSTFGPVTTLDITIPSPEKKKETAVSNAEGKALLAKVIEGLGGEAKVNAVKSLRVKMTILAKTPQGELPLQAERLLIFPDRLWMKMTTPVGEMTIVYSPRAAFTAATTGTHDLSASQKEEMASALKTDPIFVAQHKDDPSFILAAEGTEKVGGVEAQVLDVNADGAAVRWYVDPQSGRILRSAERSVGPQGPGEVVTDFADFKIADGMPVPYSVTRSRNGQKESSVEVQEVEFNTAVDPQLFEKPPAQAEEKPVPPPR